LPFTVIIYSSIIVMAYLNQLLILTDKNNILIRSYQHIRIKQVFQLVLFLLLLSCSKETDKPVKDEVVKFAVETGDSELPYIQITSKSMILNEPKVSGEMSIFINKKSVLKTPIGI
jgi:hypothetical protein